MIVPSEKEKRGTKCPRRTTTLSTSPPPSQRRRREPALASSVTEATHSGRSPATSLAAATTERRLLRSTGINLRHLLPLLLLLLPSTRDAAAGSLRSSAAVGRSPRAPRRCDNESKSLESGRESEILKTSCLEKETLEKKLRCPVDPLSSLSLLSLFSLSSLSLLSLSHLRRCLSLQTLSSLSLFPPQVIDHPDLS